MMKHSHRIFAALFAAAALGAALSAQAQAASAAPPDRQPGGEGGPWLPPALRTPDPTPPSSGKALQEEVNRKLLRQFQSADVTARGAITADEAKNARFGFVAQHFDEIDTARQGRVTFDQIKTFLEARAR